MPDAVLDGNVYGDALVGVVDDIRRTVREALGTRPYKVEIVKRSWSGGRVGVGTPAEDVLELDPAPMVEEVARDRNGPGGSEAAGDLVLTEVSLRYSEEELKPLPEPSTEVAYRIRDAHGQKQRDRYFILSGDPIPRRGDKTSDRSDWRLVLRRTSDFSPLDGAPSP